MACDFAAPTAYSLWLRAGSALFVLLRTLLVFWTPVLLVRSVSLAGRPAPPLTAFKIVSLSATAAASLYSVSMCALDRRSHAFSSGKFLVLLSSVIYFSAIQYFLVFRSSCIKVVFSWHRSFHLNCPVVPVSCRIQGEVFSVVRY